MPEEQKGTELAKKAMEEVPTITCDAFWAREERDDRPTVLDVREESEWEAGHIDWATHIPRGKLEFQAEQLLPDKNEEIVICCAKGGRAALAGKTLIEMGYKDVKYLSGGYTGYCAKEDN